MLRGLLLCLSVAACATASGPAAPSLGAALSCAADVELICPVFGCTAMQPGETRRGSVAVEIPAQGDVGRACEGGLCRPARFLPTLTRALGWTADVYAGADMSVRRGEVEVAADRGSFHWRIQDEDALYVWRGLCQASGS